MSEIKKIKRIVVKIGSSLFCSGDSSIDLAILSSIVREQVVKLMDSGIQVCVVSSGAIALGMNTLGLKERPARLAQLQACAAVGQNALMNAFQKSLDKGFHCAQVLLTWEDFTDRGRWLNARNTLNTLMAPGAYAGRRIIPVINENDTVSTNEIRFGDNDQLSARVACLVSADLLVLLSDVDGLLDRGHAVVRIVEKITPEVRALAAPTGKKTSVGGMVTKLDAVKIASDAGIPSVIANGRRKGIILSAVLEPERAGTFFCARSECLAERERWIAFGTKRKGTIIVDAGAVKALSDRKSLLAVGIVGLKGDFGAGDIVSVAGTDLAPFAVGKVALGSVELQEAKGKRFSREIIHRDDIVLI